MTNIVHVMGTGTIGEPLIGLLCDLKSELGIDEVTFYKHSPVITDKPKVKNLVKRGGVLCVRKEKFEKFRELELEPTYTVEEAIERATVVIDCSPTGKGLENKEKYYEKCDNAERFLAQGSEFGFGKMYAAGINEEAITPKDRFIHIVSCNTHNIAVVIKSVALDAGRDNFVSGRFLCIRRANDISQEGGFVASPKVSQHDDSMGRGTHHARDVWHLYNTFGHDLDVFSSAIKINTQYMHSIWYDIKVKNKTSKEEIEERFRNNPRIAVTNKKLAGLVFSFGRDHGHYGRLLNQTVVVLPTTYVKDGREVIGFCFTPQDGNSLLSSVSATERILYPGSYKEKLKALSPFLFDEV